MPRKQKWEQSNIQAKMWPKYFPPLEHKQKASNWYISELEKLLKHTKI